MPILKFPVVMSLLFMVSPILGIPLLELMLRPQPGNYDMNSMNVSNKSTIILKLVLVIYFKYSGDLYCILQYNLRDQFPLT